jgi:hypothetical protein
LVTEEGAVRSAVLGWGMAVALGLAACGGSSRVATTTTPASPTTSTPSTLTRTTAPATTTTSPPAPATTGTAANPGGWPKQVRINFITSCTLTSGGQTNRCGCVADKLSKEIPAAQVDSVPVTDPRVQAALKSC